MITMKHQEELLSMLGKISTFFEEHDIRYYLLGGSCIGALRHRGFIPWDDDADLMIDRDNYYKLLACIDEWPHEDIEFSCIERNPAWYRPFAQFSSTTNTVYQKSLVFNRGLSLGTKIDLMIIDYVPHDREKEYQHDFLLYQEASNFVFPYRTEIGLYAEEYEEVKQRQETVGRAVVLDELKRKLEVYSPEESDRRVVRFWSKISKGLRFFDAAWLQEPCYRDFEGLQLPVPTKPEACLRFQYGFDWYRVPSMSAAHTHKYFFNWDVPGIKYHEHLSQYLDFDALDALSEQRKRFNVQRLQYKLKLDAVSAEIAVRRLMLDFDFKALSRKFAALDGDERDKNVLEDLRPLWDARKELSRVPSEHLGIPDDIIRWWVIALVKDGRYFDALKAYRACTAGYAAPMTADAASNVTLHKGIAALEAETLELLDRVLRLAAAYQDNDIPALWALVDYFDANDRAEIPDVILALIKLKDAGIDIEESWDDLLKLCDSQLEKHPDNWDISKAKADLLMKAGRSDEAFALYQDVHENTRNGLVLLELEDAYGFVSRFAPNSE